MVFYMNYLLLFYSFIYLQTLMRHIFTLFLLFLNMGGSEVITWTGESSNEWDNPEKYQLSFFTPLSFLSSCWHQPLSLLFFYSWDTKTVPSIQDNVHIGKGSKVVVEYGEASSLQLHGELSVLYMLEASVKKICFFPSYFLSFFFFFFFLFFLSILATFPYFIPFFFPFWQFPLFFLSCFFPHYSKLFLFIGDFHWRFRNTYIRILKYLWK